MPSLWYRRFLVPEILSRKVDDSTNEFVFQYIDPHHVQDLQNVKKSIYFRGVESLQIVGGHKNFQPKNFSNRLCCHCGMKKWVGTWPISFRFQLKVGGHVPIVPTHLWRPCTLQTMLMENLSVKTFKDFLHKWQLETISKSTFKNGYSELYYHL